MARDEVEEGIGGPEGGSQQEVGRYRTLEIHEVAVNQPLVADLFELPPPPGMETFADLGGEWEVTFEHRNRPEVPFETATVR